MSPDQTMQVVCDRYRAELLQNLHKQCAVAAFTDVGLRLTENRIIRAHRNVLSASSAFFAAMFNGSLMEAKSDVVDLQYVASSNVVEQLIDFIYTGCITITCENAQNLLEAADMLQLLHVVDSCCKFLTQHLNDLNCIDILLLAESRACVDLQSSAEAYIIANFSNVSSSDEILQLPVKSLLRILCSDDLRLDTESQVLEMALKWLLTDVSARRRYVNEVMEVVRIPLIPSSLLRHQTASCVDAGIRVALQDLSSLDENCRTSAGYFPPRLCQPRRQARRLIYVVGGYLRDPGSRWSDSCTLSQVDCYDTSRSVWTTVPPLRVARSGVGVTALDGVVYAIGGESDSLIFDSVECLDPLVFAWRTIEPMTTPRCGAGVCAVGKSVFVFGGWVGSAIGTSVEVYDSRNKIWSVYDDMPADLRYSMGIVEFQGLIYLAGGLNELNVELRSVDCYNPVTKQWLPMASMNTKRAHFSLVALGANLYAVGGWNEHDGALASVEKYSVEQVTEGNNVVFHRRESPSAKMGLSLVLGLHQPQC